LKGTPKGNFVVDLETEIFIVEIIPYLLQHKRVFKKNAPKRKIKGNDDKKIPKGTHILTSKWRKINTYITTKYAIHGIMCKIWKVKMIKNNCNVVAIDKKSAGPECKWITKLRTNRENAKQYEPEE
jgi:hypothetical protein